ncbi:MAG: hypothetical protein ABI656_10905 [bacterium]
MVTDNVHEKYKKYEEEDIGLCSRLCDAIVYLTYAMKICGKCHKNDDTPYFSEIRQIVAPARALRLFRG